MLCWWIALCPFPECVLGRAPAEKVGARGSVWSPQPVWAVLWPPLEMQIMVSKNPAWLG